MFCRMIRPSCSPAVCLWRNSKIKLLLITASTFGVAFALGLLTGILIPSHLNFDSSGLEVVRDKIASDFQNSQNLEENRLSSERILIRVGREARHFPDSSDYGEPILEGPQNSVFSGHQHGFVEPQNQNSGPKRFKKFLRNIIIPQPSISTQALGEVEYNIPLSRDSAFFPTNSQPKYELALGQKSMLSVASRPWTDGDPENAAGLPAVIPGPRPSTVLLRQMSPEKSGFALRPLQGPTTGGDGFLDRIISDGIFWSQSVEEILPSGFTHQQLDSWKLTVNTSRILNIEDGCGRMQNRMVTLDGGQVACCRYRQNDDQIQGEIFSHVLGSLLKIPNIPPSVLNVIRGKESQWEKVRSRLSLAQWSPDKPMVMAKFVDDLVPSYIPDVLRNQTRRLHPVPEDLGGRSLPDLIELAQWSDLIVFDYLTANLDRVVNNMFNEQWNSGMMSAPAHNLAKVNQTGLLVFLDNESGLLHGYRLLDKYEPYHRSLLQSLCVFRRKTVDQIAKFDFSSDVVSSGTTKQVSVPKNLLSEQMRTLFLQQNDPKMLEWLPFLPERSLRTLTERIGNVHRQIKKCMERYGTGNSRKRR